MTELHERVVTPELSTKARLAFTIARARACYTWPYFRHAFMALQYVEEPRVGDMGGLGFGVDKHWRCYVDPFAVAKMSVEDSAVGLRHEIIHLLQRHHTRAQSFPGANHTLVNQCEDAEINDGIADDIALNSGMPHFHDMCLLDSDATPTKLSEMYGVKPTLADGRLWEEYYQAIKDKAQKQPQQQQPGGDKQGPKGPRCCGSGATGQPMPWDQPAAGGKGENGKDVPAGITTAETMMVIQSTAREVKTAAAKGIGKIPSDLIVWANEELGEPQVDWHDETMRAICSAAEYIKGAVDYTYSRPSRRQSAMGDVVMPGMRQPIPEIVLIQDTSGSMSKEDIRAGVTETQALCTALGCEVTVYDWDSTGHSKPQRVSSAYQLQLQGGGNTNMSAAIHHAAGLQPRPDLIIVHTDGGTPWPEEDVFVPVIAVIVGPTPGERMGCPEWIKCCWIEPSKEQSQ